MNDGAKAAAAMFLYAAVMVGGGVAVFAMAPEGADARTALLVPMICAATMVVCAMLTLQVHRVPVLGRVGITAGLVFPLVFAAAVGFRAVQAGEDVTAYERVGALYAEERAAGSVPEGADARAAFFAEHDAPDHDKAYLRNALWLLSAASAGAFAMIYAQRPGRRPPAAV